ncbi:serine-rich adhesin for platelets isoform X4 [Tenebrio molitor]
MNEVGSLGVRGLAVSPDSDCNSNHHGSASYLSNTSSQDIDFIQDNSDYQWFLDYGYRDGGTNHHTSILSLPESYEANDINYYDALAKNMDANLAEADMESFRTEDIHALLTNLPPMCTDHLSQENNRQGESYASVSGSMMAKFDFDSSISPHSSSHGEDSANSTSMSIYKSELLFSPVKEMPMPGANFSVDSLDCDMMLTCQANKDNYTIAFEGSAVYSEDSDYHDTDKSETSGTGSAHWPHDGNKQQINAKIIDASMTQSDSGSFTTWSKLKKRCSDNQLRRHPSGNNNNSGDETSHLGLSENSAKSQSMPNLYKQKLKTLLVSNYLKNQNLCSTDTVKRKPVKVFDIQHQSSSGSGVSVSDMATSVDASTSDHTGNKQQPNFSLVKLFMKQKSMSTEGMSTTMDQLSSTENWPPSQSGESNSSESKPPEPLKNSVDQKTNDSSMRTYDLIAEEPEDEISRSESVEQLSESISKIDSVGSFENERISPETHFNLNNNNSYLSERNKSQKSETHCRKVLTNELMNRSIQTSQFSEITSLKNAHRTVVNNKQPIKVVEPSFLNKLKQEGEIQKPVYVLYPNYVLPNLDFLNEKQEDMAKVLLIPQEAPSVKTAHKRRPFSCNDVEMLKKKGFGHVQDWDSLNFLLPQEYRKILAEVPEISEHIRPATAKEKPSFAQTRAKRRPFSCDYTGFNPANTSSSSSTGTQPSSGYRGSSTILSDSQNSPAPATNLNPLFVYRYDSVTSSEASLLNSERQRSITTAPPLPVRCVSLQQGDHIPPRPPLPKSILRKEKGDGSKRYSLYETSEEDLTEDALYKRKSLQEPYFLRTKRFSETEDEGVDAGTSSSSADEHHESLRTTSPSQPKTDFLLSNISTDELAQLEEFLKISGISTSDNEEITEESLMQLRSYVGRFLALKINQEGAEHFGGKKSVSFAEKVNVLPKYLEAKQFIAPNNSPNVSAFIHHKNYHTKTLVDMPICEESEGSPNYSSPQTTPVHKQQSSDLVEKRSLMNAVTDAVEQLVNHFRSASNQAELNMLGDSGINPSCAKLALSTLCPALYAVLSDGLKPSLESSFGAINNSVWQVVEASAQQGPLTKALNELVMRINSEDAITEGLVKFNAFVFGLLNVRSLDAWMSYLKTRESVLKKHYSKDSMLIMAHTGGLNVRTMLDTLIAALQPLALLPFQFDLLFEYRQLHLSFKRMDSYQQQLSPTHKHSVSPNFKQWTSPKLGLSACSNRSNSESEDISAITVQHFEAEPSLPDLLNSSGNSKPKCRPDKERPRSCVESGMLSKPNFKLGDVTTAAKKRWSGISVNSKLYLVYDRLAREEEEEYTDSLENATQVKPEEVKSDESNSNENVPSLQEDGPESLDSNISDEKPLNGRRFKKLQQKWEMLSGREPSQSPPSSPTNTANKSKIPRPITSPVKPSGIPVLISPSGKQNGKLSKKNVTPSATKGIVGAKTKPAPLKKQTSAARTSRVDQLETNSETPRHIPRPSSLPYKAATTQNGKASKITPPRRAASSSLNRKPLNKTSVPKIVRTLSHRVPSESGHLSYNEGERLKVVLEVDDKWLLCCRGSQKGLVPKSAVIAADMGRF